MNIPDEAPKLNPWPFIVADVVLLGTAALIAMQARAPLAGMSLVVVGVLIFFGSLLAVVPFLLNYTRKQELALTERQREIAALAQTTSASAEQLSIAAASLHSIAETAAKSAKQAEALPQKLQEKIHEFKEQLNEVSVTENEALSEEVNTLRSAETERIESILTTLRKLSSEIARLEAASRQNVTDLTHTLTGFTTSAEQAAAEATTAVASMRAGAEKSLATAHASALGAIQETLSHALAEIDTKLSTLSGHLTAKIDHASQVFDSKIAELQNATTLAAFTPAAGERRQRRESQEPRAEATSAPVSPETQPSVGNSAPAQHAVTSDRSPVTISGSDSVPEETEGAEAKPRKRTLKRPSGEHELTLGLDLPSDSDETNQVGPEDAASSIAVSADGATRLLVTAYIGIGNKLFVRGEGPGLSWEKGTALQFVSIGKWRWETAEAAQPVRAKLYKNDEQECGALGELSIEPGHQREVTATF